MRILLIGGSGQLGKELCKLDPGIVAPSRAELDITDEKTLKAYFKKCRPDIVIHAAAETNNLLVEADPTTAIQVNIKGTANVALASLSARLRLIYLSTDYIYKGDRGNYREDDEILPYNPYAWSKLGGETSVRMVPNHLIIRTSFGANKFPYDVAFQDKWSSKDYVDRLAPLVLEAAKSPLTGILNLGTERKTLFDHARERNARVKPIRLNDSAFATPRDTSLNLQRWTDYHGQNPMAHPRGECRTCASKNLEIYLDLGLMPLANKLANTAQEARAAPRLPLQVLFCKDCHLSQLSIVVDPKVLFSHYTYRSGINPGFIRHCRKMAQTLKTAVGLGPDDLVVDIAGNDGTLLSQFKEETASKVLNVEPASNIAAISAASKITTINEFWGPAVAAQIIQKHQRPKLITATNVFAHVDDVTGFLRSIKDCLDPGGTVVLEFPYLVSLISKNEFDTVYFEHLSYLLIRPLVTLTRHVGMTLYRVEQHDIHGGSVRVYIRAAADAKPEPSVRELCDQEEKLGFHASKIYQDWSISVDRLVESLTTNLIALKRSGAKIAAFGASAKGNTLLNSCRFNTNTIDYIVDDTPEKIGKFSPGTGIPIVNRHELSRNRPDYLLVLAWNFLDDVMLSTADFSAAGGKYIVPVPEYRIIDLSTPKSQVA